MGDPKVTNTSSVRWEVARVSVLRAAVAFALIVTAALIGFGAYYFLHKNQSTLEKQEYSALVEKIQTSTIRSLSTQLDAVTSVAATLAFVYPNSSMWPNAAISISNFEEMINPLSVVASRSRTVGTATIVTPSQVPSFEAYMDKYLNESGYRKQLPELGLTPFGTAVYAVEAGQLYHATTAWSGARRNILTPGLNVANLASNFQSVMFNVYSERNRCDAIDYAIDCGETTAGMGQNCSTMTGVIFTVADFPHRTASSLIIHPIKLTAGNIVAIAIAEIQLELALSAAINEQVSGLLLVLQFGSDGFCTFDVQDGVVAFLGEGDLHDAEFNERRYSFLATDFGPAELRFHVHIYPSDQWIGLYHNSLPAAICGVTVGILTMTALVFLFYDRLMSLASLKKDLVLQTKRQFVRYVSHEIRTPTNIVQLGFKLLYSEMFALRASLQSTMPHYAAVLDKFEDWMQLVLDVATSADAAIAVLNDLINYDKLQMGKLLLEVEPVFVWDLLTPTVQPFAIQARCAGVRLELDCEPARAAITRHDRQEMRQHVVLGDGTKLAQVLRNVVSNAIKFTPSGGLVSVVAEWSREGLPGVQPPTEGERSAEVEASQYTRCGSLVVTVRDNGAGMSNENLLRLFQEGMQFHATQLQAGGGSGLGLWIAKGIVAMHHGLLTAHSEGEGQGSKFTLELPLFSSAALRTEAEEEEEERGRFGLGGPHSTHPSTVSLASLGEHSDVTPKPDTPPPTSVPPPVPAELRTLNVLVTDDSVPSRKMVCRLLRAAGYTCFEAGDGQECVDKVALAREGAHPPIHAVLMDYEMPRMNGPTATAVLRSMGCGIPVFGITGNVLKEDREAFLAHGALRVLAKPFSPPELLALLRSIAVEQPAQ